MAETVKKHAASIVVDGQTYLLATEVASMIAKIEKNELLERLVKEKARPMPSPGNIEGEVFTVRQVRPIYKGSNGQNWVDLRFQLNGFPKIRPGMRLRIKVEGGE